MASGGSEVAARLAVYGTLMPGRENHHELAGIAGTWRAGTVRGRLYPYGVGAALGYPALVLRPDGPEVAVQVLESPDLPDHWVRLDAFEGDAYRRVVTEALTGDGIIGACIYVLAED